jgi:FAD/FMN-containing dehydrogenase/Fe-S oxidoreductase
MRIRDEDERGGKIESTRGTGTIGTSDVANPEFVQALRAELSGGVRFDAQARAIFAADASNYRIPPLGVLFPRTRDEALAALRTCREFGVSVVPRGSGTSIGGQAVGPGVVIDCSRHLDRILAIDPVARTAVVEPGVVLDDLQRAAAPYGLRFGPDPSTHNRCTLGGMIGNNACGSHSLRYGKTDANVVELEIATYDGAVLVLSTLGTTGGDGDRAAELEAAIRTLLADAEGTIREETSGVLPRRVSGYGLAHLLPEHGENLAAAFVGTEGTCGLILTATVRLVPVPVGHALLIVGFSDAYAAADAVPEVIAHDPLTVEGIDRRIVALASRTRRPAVELPVGDAYLFIEVDGATAEAATSRAESLGATLSAPGRAYRVLNATEAAEAWRIRDDGAGLATRLADGTEAWPGFEDAAVPPEHLGAYLRAFDVLLEEHGLSGIPYGHFGEGCIHVRIDFDLLSAAGVAGYRKFMEEAAALVASFGGSISGEHGDGQARGELLPAMYAPAMLDAFARFKAAFDPMAGMNPGRGVAPRPLDEDLRVFDLLPTTPVRTTLLLGEDHRDLAAAARRCVGVGKCIRLDGGSMCPSYQVTRAEEHSTRGRARLIAEMLGGDLAEHGWRSPEVRDALDLCLGCKACRVECPVGVDMAAYKVEFLSHYYRGRIRPRSHYAFGFLPVALRLASRAPRVANALLSAGVFGRWVRRLGGIAPEAVLPKIATSASERMPAVGRAVGAREAASVVRFGDCFSRFVEPDVADAADDVLERLGFDATVVGGANCCGLTWYSTGQLGIARRVLARTVATLRRSGTGPIVVLEPSCAAMLREDALDLLGTACADVAERVVSLGELIAPLPLDVPGAIDENIVAQVHCHAFAGGKYRAELTSLEARGAALAAVETRCCGLAGNFGLEAGHEDVASAIAARHIGATLDGVSPETLVMADGFSCRTQIAAKTGRTARHFAQILRDALATEDRSAPSGE